MRIDNVYLKKWKTRKCEVCNRSVRTHRWIYLNVLGVIYWCSHKDDKVGLEQSKDTSSDGGTVSMDGMEVHP